MMKQATKKTLLLDAHKDSEPLEDSVGKDNKQFSFSNFSDEFDDHINNSIRGFSDLRNDVVAISKYFVENDTTVLDLGCSQGSLLRSINTRNEQAPKAKYLGVDINQAFAKHWKNEDNIAYKVDDITKMEFPNNISLATSLFTMQFVPERKRLDLIQKIYQKLIKGGAFIFSEKFLSEDGKSQNIIDSLYHEFKRQHFTEQEIMDKEKELRHLMKCSYESTLIKQLQEVGFSEIQCFWRNFNFAAFYAVKTDVG